MTSFLAGCAVVASLVAVQTTGSARQPAPPALRFETLDARPADEPRLRRLDRNALGSIVQLVGLEDAGPPIRVVLAPEDSELARTTSPWIAGFAHGATGTVVLFPSRSVRYPHDSLEDVVRHEVAHVLIVRAAGGRAVPRWFNEGLAVVAERAWQFEDRWQLAWVLTSGDRARMDEVNDLFQAGSSGARRAYVLSSAFVRYVIDTHGPDVPARILAAVANGVPFDVAFERTTGRSLVSAERGFHAELTSWTRRLPFLTSPYVLWLFVTVLALFAIFIRRRRNAERRRKWEEEEARAVSGGCAELNTSTSTSEATVGDPPAPPKEVSMSLPKTLHPWNPAEQLAQADRVIARETKQRAGILCAWCLGFVPEPSEPGPDSHGMCPTCSARFEAEALHAKPLGGRDN